MVQAEQLVERALEVRMERHFERVVAFGTFVYLPWASAPRNGRIEGSAPPSY